jgi:DNA-directed RNA polymerase specialized sigma subunit
MPNQSIPMSPKPPVPPKELKPAKETKGERISSAYKTWLQKPSPSNMASLLDASEPVLQSAITSYAGGNQAMMTQAKKLAAGAFQTYDPRKGTQLHSHLMTQLQPLQRITRERTQAVKIPERVSMDLYRLHQAEQSLSDSRGREASDIELADHMGTSLKRIRHLRKYNKSETAESGLMARDEEGDTEVFYPGVNKIDPEKTWVEYIYYDSDPVDQKILEWKTGYNGKQQIGTNEIAKRLKLSPGAVSQRSARLANKLAEIGRELGDDH